MLNSPQRTLIILMVSLLFIVSFLPEIMGAQQTEFERWQETMAQKTSYYNNLNEEAKALASQLKTTTANSFKVPVAKAADTSMFLPAAAGATQKTEAQCQADPDCASALAFGVLAPETAMIGDTVPIMVIARNAQNVGAVDLSINDPKTNKDFYKDSFTNINAEDQFSFSYSWDTITSQTNADSGNSTHRVYADFYDTNNDLIGTSTTDIKVSPFSSSDPLTDGFWGGYIRNDGSYSADWKAKLGCASDASICKDMSSTKTALTSAITNGNVSELDISNLENSFSHYTTQIGNGVSGGDEAQLQTTVQWLNMSDLIGTLDTQMDANLGVPDTTLSQDFMLAPETLTVADVLDEWSPRISSYNPQSAADFIALPFYSQIKTEVENKIDRDPINLVSSISDITPSASSANGIDSSTGGNDIVPPDGSTGNVTAYNPNSFGFFMNPGIAKATDPVGIAMDAGFLVYDAWDLIKKPSWGKAAWAVADVGFLAWDVFLGGGGEVHAGLAGGKIGAKILEHLPSIGRLADKAVHWYEAVKGSKVVTKLLEKVGGLKDAIIGGQAAIAKFLTAHPTLAKILDKLNPIGPEAWKTLTGGIKKFIAGIGGFIARNVAPLINAALHAGAALIEAGGECTKVCDASKWLWVIPTISSIICDIECAVIDWFSQALGKAFNTIVVPNLL